MKTVLVSAVALVVGLAIGVVLCEATIRHLRKRLKESRARKPPGGLVRSVTKFLFVTTQLFALGWVSVSYGIAIYSTVKLHQPFPVVELSQQAINTILGASVLKVLANIFEHNDGPVFGQSKNEIPSDGGSEEENFYGESV